jgi:hypothetical protein
MIFSKIFCSQNWNEKSNSDFTGNFFVLWKLYADLSLCGGRHSSGVGGIAEAPWSVKMIDPRDIIERFH